MSCRRSATKNLTRKSKSCCNSRCDLDSSTSDSSSDSSDSFSTSSDSSCGCSDCDCYDCYYSPLNRRKGKGKAKGRTLQPKKTSKLCKSPCSAKKKPARRTRGSSSGPSPSCCGSKSDCSDGCSSDDAYGDCYDCGPPKPKPKTRQRGPPKRQRLRRTVGLK